jgi:hypothetical protein
MVRYAGPIIALALSGCFYPPQQTVLPDSRTHLIVQLPYYKVWDAVHDVVIHNDYRIITEDPDQGTIEAQAAGGFTVDDADCGRLKGIGGKYEAEPDADASAVYDFEIKPKGNEATSVNVEGTFTAPLHVPLHPPSGEQCVSRGTQEARLLKEIARHLRNESGPVAKTPATPLPARETVQ